MPEHSRSSQVSTLPQAALLRGDQAFIAPQLQGEHAPRLLQRSCPRPDSCKCRDAFKCSTGADPLRLALLHSCAGNAPKIKRVTGLLQYSFALLRGSWATTEETECGKSWWTERGPCGFTQERQTSAAPPGSLRQDGCIPSGQPLCLFASRESACSFKLDSWPDHRALLHVIKASTIAGRLGAPDSNFSVVQDVLACWQLVCGACPFPG